MTGVVFNGADLKSDAFVVKNQRAKKPDGSTVQLSGSARLVFVTDS